ncbi:MAG: hypothetical protein IPM45_18300 [Acidimicrobiales bacterium]|nr:hypothetical protein [Acidimicrobiales bacterium]
MGRREIETTTKRVVQTCDLCDRDLGGISPERCLVCGREAGYCCSTLRLCYDARRPGMIDLALRVCRDCELAGREEPTPPLEVIAAAVKKADGVIGAALGLWRKGSQEWRRRKGGVG